MKIEELYSTVGCVETPFCSLSIGRKFTTSTPLGRKFHGPVIVLEKISKSEAVILGYLDHEKDIVRQGNIQKFSPKQKVYDLFDITKEGKRKFITGFFVIGENGTLVPIKKEELKEGDEFVRIYSQLVQVEVKPWKI